MKTCRKCNIEKPVSEYYRKSDNPDGVDRWCKDCRKQYARENYKSTRLPYSTEKVIQLLNMNGIPTNVGYAIGKPRKDIVAYGYITVEAKSALPHGRNGYIFGLTKSQKQEHCDYYVLLCKDTERVFVVPGESPVLTLEGAALYINVTDPRLAQYENAFHQIKDRVMGDIMQSSPILEVTVHSGANYYQIASV